MANESGSYDQDLEDRIRKIVNKTREKRCRPCFQSIHTKLNQGGKEITMDDLKVFIEQLIKSGLLINKGSADKESFYLSNDEPNDEQIELENGDQDNNISSVLFNELESGDQNNNISSVFINETFYQGLMIKINDEVKKAVKIELQSCVKDHKLVVNDHEEFVNDQMHYKKLMDEIKLLRDELKYKDEVIKKLRSDINRIKPKQLFNVRDINKSKINSVKKKTDDKNTVINMNSDIDNQNNDNGDVNTSVAGTDLINNKRSVTILGDSVVKDIKPFKMKRMLGKNDRLYVKSFPGATTTDMIDYCKPCLRHNPNVIIYHAGTNNLNTKEEPNTIANNIVKHAIDMKTDSNEVNISSLIIRDDKLNEKAAKVNDFLKIKCSKYGLRFIDNSNVTKEHLNKSGIHLNFKGTVTLAKNFMASIQN